MSGALHELSVSTTLSSDSSSAWLRKALPNAASTTCWQAMLRRSGRSAFTSARARNVVVACAGVSEPAAEAGAAAAFSSAAAAGGADWPAAVETPKGAGTARSAHGLASMASHCGALAFMCAGSSAKAGSCASSARRRRWVGLSASLSCAGSESGAETSCSPPRSTNSMASPARLWGVSCRLSWASRSAKPRRWRLRSERLTRR
mmetsp:Transcript_44662/g.112565  ORF Transcript_44662/g.112565 Transcript_44662/m.112565 type:complete len:204 (+) Transcript_44662:1926-2537(+)